MLVAFELDDEDEPVDPLTPRRAAGSPSVRCVVGLEGPEPPLLPLAPNLFACSLEGEIRPLLSGPEPATLVGEDDSCDEGDIHCAVEMPPSALEAEAVSSTLSSPEVPAASALVRYDMARARISFEAPGDVRIVLLCVVGILGTFRISLVPERPVGLGGPRLVDSPTGDTERLQDELLPVRVAVGRSSTLKEAADTGEVAASLAPRVGFLSGAAASRNVEARF